MLLIRLQSVCPLSMAAIRLHLTTPTQPSSAISPNGKANGKPGFWPKDKANFAPRLSIVYSPDTKTSIRAGWGLYYDHFGEALTSQFSRRGSFGLSSQYQSAPNSVSYETAPRFTG